jgi:hypothetical protein
MKKFTAFLAVALFVGLTIVSANVSWAFDQWTLSTDILSAADQPTAVYPDVAGTPVWSFLKSASLDRTVIDPSTYTLMDIFNPDSHRLSGLKAWQKFPDGSIDCNGNYPDSCAPMVAINASGNTLGNIPAGSFGMHPGSGNMAIVAWKNPYSTRITVDVSATFLLSGAGSDGIDFFVDYEAEKLSAGTLSYGQAKMVNFHQRVGPGKSLYFIVHPYGAHYSDWVKLDLVIVKR